MVGIVGSKGERREVAGMARERLAAGGWVINNCWRGLIQKGLAGRTEAAGRHPRETTAAGGWFAGGAAEGAREDKGRASGCVGQGGTLILEGPRGSET
jgi:hypothetical protein